MRRVSIGTELAARASILLCDEPTSALDAEGAAEAEEVRTAAAADEDDMPPLSP